MLVIHQKTIEPQRAIIIKSLKLLLFLVCKTWPRARISLKKNFAGCFSMTQNVIKSADECGYIWLDEFEMEEDLREGFSYFPFSSHNFMWISMHKERKARERIKLVCCAIKCSDTCECYYCRCCNLPNEQCFNKQLFFYENFMRFLRDN